MFTNKLEKAHYSELSLDNGIISTYLPTEEPVSFLRACGYGSNQHHKCLEVESALSRGIAKFSVLFAGCLLAVTLAAPAWAVSSQPATARTRPAASHGRAIANSTPKIFKAQLHPLPKDSPQALGPGFGLLCYGDVGIILYPNAYQCMFDGFGTYNTPDAVYDVVTFVSGRVWLHTTGGDSYCGTPNGDYPGMNLEPAINLSLASVQISTNPADCTPDDDVMFIVNQTSPYAPYVVYNAPLWDSWTTSTSTPPYNINNPSKVAGIDNGTSYRIWFHGTTSKGAAYSDCVNPGSGFYSVTGEDTDPTSIQVTNNGSSC